MFINIYIITSKKLAEYVGYIFSGRDLTAESLLSENCRLVKEPQVKNYGTLIKVS